MGKRNRQRRADKRRAQARHRGAPEGGGAGPGDRSARPVRELLGSVSLAAMVGADAVVAPVVSEIVDRHEQAPAEVAEAVVGALRGAVAACWERGWQPADLAHHARRKLGASGAAVCAAAIAIQADAYRYGPGADPGWLGQVDSVEPAGPPPAGDQEALGYLAGLVGGLAAAVTGAAAALGLLGLAPMLPLLVDPPSTWGRGPARSAARVGDPKVAARVRALLAKAESTEFAEEAETFTAKAQELIAKHAIDQAMLDDEQGGGEVEGRRVLLDDPYSKAKSVLLAQVASANRCRTVTSRGLGFSTVFGYPGDLDAVEVLFASLLTQATGAMVVASRAAGPGRVRSFRQAFLIAFADRIGQRLRAAAEGVVAEARAVHGAGLLPVLVARDEEVVAARDAAFGRLTSQRISVSNGAGYAAGRAAADLADLGPSGRLKAG